MIKHYLLLFIRNFNRQRGTFLINFVGLTCGLTCTLFFYLWVADELSMDTFHKNDDRLFQVMEKQHLDNSISVGEGTPDLLAETLEDEMPEIEYAIGATPSKWFGDFVLKAENSDKIYKEKGQFVGKEFFKMFSFELLHGNKDQVLEDKSSIVISENLALRLFGSTEDAIGKTLSWNLMQFNDDCIITGVFKDLPQNSTEEFDFLITYESWKEITLMIRDMHWDNHGPQTYILLKENVDAAAFNEKIKDFIKTKLPTSNVTLFLKPYSEKYLYGSYENGKQAGGRIEYVRLFTLIALFILAIACINFMNLSTAKASTRLKEIGVRKTIGASRGSLIIQFISEAIFISMISIMISLVLVEILLPFFNNLTGKELDLKFDYLLIISILSLSILSGLAAGSYPAMYLSGFKPAVVLKGKLNASTGEGWARKGLVIFQFSLSIIMIISVIVIYKQIQYVQNKNLGYEKENVIFFPKEGAVATNYKTFLSQLKEIPGVKNASATQHSIMEEPSTTWGVEWVGKDPDAVVEFENYTVEYDFIETLGIDIKEGRSFNEQYATDFEAIIFNEKAIEIMGIEDPIGKAVNLWGGDRKIIGVVKDFHFESLHKDVKPLFFKLTRPDQARNVIVRIEQGKVKQTLAAIGDFYKDINPGYNFNYVFLDQKYEAQYITETRVGKLSRIFAGLAILISCLGLFGLASFTAERKIKEIGIRKVLGSGDWNIVKLLSASFTKFVLIAILIAIPVSYLMLESWINDFAYRIELEPWYFIVSGFAALLVAWLTVGGIAFKASKLNPVNCLKTE